MADRLISAEAFRKTMEESEYLDECLLDDAPEAVVRCKDCKHYWKNKQSDEVPVCLASPREDAYCSEGERREDGNNDRN